MFWVVYVLLLLLPISEVLEPPVTPGVDLLWDRPDAVSELRVAELGQPAAVLPYRVVGSRVEIDPIMETL